MDALSGRTFMLYTKQNELFVTVRVLRVCHYATYSWQIDDEATKTVGSGARRLDKIGNGDGAPSVIGCLGEGGYKLLTLA